jgi:site-specific recombinase XerD
MRFYTLQFGTRGYRDRVVMETFYATGIRRTELLHLDIDDVNLSDNLLRVNHGKGNKERIVPISPRACEWIAMYKRCWGMLLYLLRKFTRMCRGLSCLRCITAVIRWP